MLQTGLATRSSPLTPPAARRASCWSTPSRWSPSRCRCASSSGSAPPGSSSARTCPGGAIVGGAARGAAGHPRLREQLRLGHVAALALRACRAGVLIATLSYFPLVYLPAAATLRRLDPALEESRRGSGRGPVRGLPRRRAAAAAAAHPGRRAAGRAAPAGRVRRLRDGPLRHVHDRDHRPVPVDASTDRRRPCSRASSCCAAWSCCWSKRAARGGGRYARIGSGAPAAASPVRLGGRSAAGSRCPRRCSWRWPSASRCVSIVRWLGHRRGGGLGRWDRLVAGAAPDRRCSAGSRAPSLAVVLALPLAHPRRPLRRDRSAGRSRRSNT